MKTDELCQMLGLKMSVDQQRAARFLEARGMIFCGHFGTDNCVDIAKSEWRKRRQELRRKRLARGK